MDVRCNGELIMMSTNDMETHIETINKAETARHIAGNDQLPATYSAREIEFGARRKAASTTPPRQTDRPESYDLMWSGAYQPGGVVD